MESVFPYSGEQLSVAGAVGCLPAEHYLLQTYRLRRNVLSDKIEYRRVEEADDMFRPLSEYAVNSILLQSRRDGNLGDDDITAEIKMLLHSDDIPAYDPVGEWLGSREWDGKERMVDLFRRIPGINAEEINWLCIWLRGVVAQWLQMSNEHGNECVPILIGAQGVGKSTFFLRLLPPCLREYYLDNFRLGNSFDKDMALSNNLLVNLDEFDSYGSSQQSKIKQALSKVKVNGRRAFGRVQDVRPRYASFTGTTNSARPLRDPTGSRRFICVDIPKDHFIDNTTPIEYEQLYAQVVHEIMVEEKHYWFTNEEVEMLQRHNAQFQQVKSIENMIRYCVRPLDEGEECSIKVSDVISMIIKTFPAVDVKQLTPVNVGRIMHGMGFASVHTKHGSCYRAALKDAA